MCIAKQYPSQAEIKALFNYDDGKLIWRESRGTAKAGAVAGTLKKNGRYQIMINSKHYYLHRLIFIYFNGEIPTDYVIDHVSGDHRNNRIENLQVISQQQNTHKSKLIHSHNKSGYRGVNWRKDISKWQSTIAINGKKLHLGVFDNIIDAAIAYDVAAIEYHKEFARTNFPIENYKITEVAA